jgi:hypothetical protein
LPTRIVLVVVAKRRLEHVFALATDNSPPDTVAVAAAIGIGIDQKPCDSVLAECFEEISYKEATAEGPVAGCRVLVQRAKDLVLLLCSCH